MDMDVSRRVFLQSTAALSTSAALWPSLTASAMESGLLAGPRAKTPGIIKGAFFFPPAKIVLAGECEDGWSPHQWFTWPGNQFEPEEQQARLIGELARINKGLDLELRITPEPLYTDEAIKTFIGDITASPPDALLLVNFWNSFSAKLYPILDAFTGPVIIYHPVGSSHQLPPERFRKSPRVQYIHSIENFNALENGLRAIHAQTRMTRSRLLRVSGGLTAEADDQEPFFQMPIHGVPAAHFNGLFDGIEITDEMNQLVAAVRATAGAVKDLEDQAFLDAVRAHVAVSRLMERHDADAIAIECLFLKHRKPCLSFSLNNGMLIPCGCENDLNASLSLMLGANLFGSGGFQHNPDFDTVENLYYASHCTCATRLQGPEGPDAPFNLRPFFHQAPKTLALDVKWPAGSPVTLFKYNQEGPGLDAWAGEVISSPECPPAGGCATRVLAKLHNVEDICDVYPGPHPILYCGDFARRASVYARLYGLECRTNV